MVGRFAKILGENGVERLRATPESIAIRFEQDDIAQEVQIKGPFKSTITQFVRVVSVFDLPPFGKVILHVIVVEDGLGGETSWQRKGPRSLNKWAVRDRSELACPRWSAKIPDFRLGQLPRHEILDIPSVLKGAKIIRHL